MVPAPVAADALLIEQVLHERAQHPDWWDDETRARVRAFYAGTLHRPAWFDGGRLAARAEQLRDILRAAPAEGISVELRLHQAVEAALADPAPTSLERLVRADVQLTGAFMRHAHVLTHGRVDPAAVHRAWVAHERPVDRPALLWQALEDGQVARALTSLAPVHPEYARLREALAHFRAIDARGGWPEVPTGTLLRRASAEADGADTGNRCEGPCEAVQLLRQALIVRGDLVDEDAGDAHAGVVDEALDAAIRRFQARHGLTVDGIVGPITFAALNVPVGDRIRQIEINMDRWRWVPDDFGPDHVRVNVPAFRLHAYERGERAFSMRVVVGRDGHLTPVFSDDISFLVFSPYWEVPDGITRRTLLPRIINDPSYVQRQRFEVVEGWQAGADTIPPDEIDWAMAREEFPYRLRQRPGPRNALGQVKFMFPNRFNVYLHDTPANQAFERADRALSHGCVRVERPVQLADWLLRHQPAWDESRIRGAMGQRSPRSVRLAETTPVHMLYFTAWVDDAGVMQFRDDLYGHDAAHAAQLPVGQLALDRTRGLGIHIETRLARLEDQVDRLLALQYRGAAPGVSESDAWGGPPAGDVR
jgi:L,D-transpeptidase YcbB